MTYFNYLPTKIDTVDTFINTELLSINNLRLINQLEFDTLTLQNIYKKDTASFSVFQNHFFSTMILPALLV